MSKLTLILIFATGFIGGSASTYFALKKRFDTLLAEEIESVKEAYNKHDKEELTDLPKKEKKSEEQFLEEVSNFLTEEKNFDEPYLISPNEFNEIYGYETSTLTLYSDGIIADEYMEIIEDVDEILGEENLRQLRDTEADRVYIRNDSKHCDYEVLRDYGTFEDDVINQSRVGEDYE